MKYVMKRSIAMLLALVLCLSLIPAIGTTVSAATVNYSYSSEGYIKNWGKRGTDATFLSPNAEEFYEDNSTTYEDLAELSGSSTTASVPSSALYKKLQTLMKSNHDYETSYDATREMYQYTDCQENGTGTNGTKISSFYSGVNIGPAWDSGGTWNREHTWPNSKGLGGNDENDIMMLRPTAKSENSSRGNIAYGEGSSYYDPNDVSGGQYNLHGDVARIMLYVYVRWGNTNYMWGGSGVMESKAILLKWMEEDPVDTWELARNDSVESITGTRNVFVDYPELGFLLFNEDLPTDMVTPSGKAIESGYTISAVANNSNYGTLSVSGSTITAFPNEGYVVTGYEILEGTATVAKNGNVFTVTTEDDCTIQINFAAREAATVSFAENGTAVSAQNLYVGDVITLPAHSGTVPAGYSFLGWVTDTLEETPEEPASIYKAGSSYITTQSVDFHALYSRVDVLGEGSSAYSLVTDIAEGDYLIIAAYQDNMGALTATVTNNRFDLTGVTVADNTVNNPAAAAVWHIAPTDDGNYTIYNESAGLYAGGSGTANQGALLSEATDFAKWKITYDNTGALTIVNVGNYNKSVNYTLRRNADFGFATYAPTTGTAPALYRKTTNTVLYSTYTISCDHAATALQNVTKATCTAAGYTGDTYCTACGSLLKTGEVIPAVEHVDVNGDYVCDNCTTEVNAFAPATDLAVGDVVILVCESKGYELSGISNTSTVYGLGTAYTEEPAGLYTLTVVAGASEGTYAFMTPEGTYLCWTSGNSLKTSTTVDANSSWTVTFDENGNAIIQNASSSSRKLQWNASAPRFATYTSSQTAVQLYKKAVASEKPCEHSNTVLEGVVAPTCTAEGYTGNKVCQDCGETLEEGAAVAALGHKEVVDAAVAPTCTATGLTEGAHCEVCGEVTAAQEEIPANGHQEVTDAAVAPTCTATGLTEGAHCEVCGEVTSAQEEIPANGHQEVTDAAVAPTCTATGLTEGAHCDVCNEITVPQEEIPANGHQEVTDAAVAPTCTATGLTEGTHCEICGEVTAAQEEIPATGHTFENDICTVCNAPKAVAMIGDVTYATAYEALNAAESGQTVIMIADSNEEDTYMVIDEGVTLDLGVYDLYAKSIVGLAGSHLTGTEYRAATDYGRLFVSEANRLVLSGHTVYNDGSLGLLPVWDGDQCCYVMGGAFYNTDNYTLTVTEEAISFNFAPSLRGDLRKAFFTDENEMSDNGLSIVLRLTWHSGDGLAQQDFVYSSEFVSKFCKSGSGLFTFTLTGYEAMYIELEDLTITPMIVCDNGLTFFGKTVTGA